MVTLTNIILKTLYTVNFILCLISDETQYFVFRLRAIASFCSIYIVFVRFL